MSAFSQLQLRAWEKTLAIDGETVTIYGATPGQTFTGQAIVVSGSGAAQEMVEGGYYEKDTYTATILKSAIGFDPEPNMLADARGKQLRIPEDGVQDHDLFWDITIVSRFAPK